MIGVLPVELHNTAVVLSLMKKLFVLYDHISNTNNKNLVV